MEYDQREADAHEEYLANLEEIRERKQKKMDRLEEGQEFVEQRIRMIADTKKDRNNSLQAQRRYG